MRARLLFLLVLLVVLPGTVPLKFGPFQPTHRWNLQTAGSVAPELGGTTGTFARAAADSRNNAGTYEAVSGGTAAITNVGAVLSGTPASGAYTRALSSSTAQGYRASAPITYVALNNNTVAAGGGAWSDLSAPTLTVNAAADPFGGTTADSIEDDAAGAVEGRTQAVTIADDITSWTLSAWAVCASSHSVDMTLALSGGTPVTTTTTFTCNSTLRKVVAQVTNNNTGNVTATITLRGTQDVASQTGTAAYSYVQLYNSAFESLSEPAVVGSTVAIEKETLEYSSLSPKTSTVGTWCAWVYVTQLPTGATETPLLSFGGVLGGTTPSWDLTVDADGDLKVVVEAGVNDAAVETVESITASTWGHVCMVWRDSTRIDTFINGAATTYSTHDDTFSSGADYGTKTGFLQGSDVRVGGTTLMAQAKWWVGRELNAGQISRIYDRERGSFGL